MNAPADTLKKKYAIAPAPESVARLATLVGKQLDNLDGIAKVINGDPALKQRLLLAANRGDPDGPIDTVDGAIMRTGVESVLVLAMTDPLGRAVLKTFSTMLGLTLASAESAPMDDSCFVSSVDFTGHANGTVHLCLRENLARAAAGIIMGMEAVDVPEETIGEVLGELTNMVAGNFKSNLSDAGLSCHLSTPSVQPVAAFTLPKATPGRRQELAFRHEGRSLLVTVTVHSLE
jgi:CheY-specific phosphatase CheX